MKHSQMICTQINQADSSLPDKKTIFTSAINGISVKVNLDDWDRLSVSLLHVEVTMTNPHAMEDGEAFIDKCNRLADRIGYLEESLKAVEVDKTDRIGIIRSYPPRVDGDNITYFDIKINGGDGSISLERVVRDIVAGQDRPGKTIIGYHLLSRLIDDFSAAAMDMFTGHD